MKLAFNRKSLAVSVTVIWQLLASNDLSKQVRWNNNSQEFREFSRYLSISVALFFLKLPLEDLCSLTSQSLPAAEPSIVPESTEDILLKGFISLEMEEERIETAQQVNGIVVSKDA